MTTATDRRTMLRETIDRAIGAVVSNASNFPEKAQTRILGQDMAPLRMRLTSAVMEALSGPPADDAREAVATVIAVTWRDTLGTPTDVEFADAILAAFDVHPLGPIVDSNVDAPASKDTNA